MACYKRYWVRESFSADERRLGSWLFVIIVGVCLVLWNQLPLNTEATLSDHATQINQSAELGSTSQVTPQEVVEQRVLVEQLAFSPPRNDTGKVPSLAVATLGTEGSLELDQTNNQAELQQAMTIIEPTIKTGTEPAIEPAAQLVSKIQIDPEELHSLLKVDINHLIEQWRQAWEAGDAERYLSFYSAQFTPVGDVSVQAWQGQRRLRIVPSRQINVSLRDFDVVFDDTNQTCVVRFEQTYVSETYNDISIKELTLVKDVDWRIIAEAAVD